MLLSLPADSCAITIKFQFVVNDCSEVFYTVQMYKSVLLHYDLSSIKHEEDPVQETQIIWIHVFVCHLTPSAHPCGQQLHPGSALWLKSPTTRCSPPRSGSRRRALVYLFRGARYHSSIFAVSSGTTRPPAAALDHMACGEEPAEPENEALDLPVTLTCGCALGGSDTLRIIALWWAFFFYICIFFLWFLEFRGNTGY